MLILNFYNFGILYIVEKLGKLGNFCPFTIVLPDQSHFVSAFTLKFLLVVKQYLLAIVVFYDYSTPISTFRLKLRNFLPLKQHSGTTEEWSHHDTLLYAL